VALGILDGTPAGTAAEHALATIALIESAHGRLAA
jgi:hypothetical protein